MHRRRSVSARKTLKKFKDIRNLFLNEKNPGNYLELLDPDIYGPRLNEEILLAIIIKGEFGILQGRDIYTTSLRALHNQYLSPKLCGGNCDSVMKQLIWLSTLQTMRQASAQFLVNYYKDVRINATELKQGKYGGYNYFHWGNY